MIKFKKLLKEIHDVETISAKDIYNFYFLWHISVNQPKLVQTPYGKETLNFYLKQFKSKYVRLFKKLLAKQILKYIQRNRIDPDFPKEIAPNLMNLSALELQKLMAKTFRSDMKRRNTVWDMVADFVTNLEKASTPKDIFLYINQLNNAVHNTSTKVMDKFPNFYSELLKAFDVVDKTTNIQMLKGLVDKDIRDLWDQEEESPYSTDSDQGERFTENIDGGLEKIIFEEQRLLNEMIGKRFVIDTAEYQYPALFSKNVKPGELPWRITIFTSNSNDGTLEPMNHVPLDNKEANGILRKNTPGSVFRKLSDFLHSTVMDLIPIQK